ncbi:MAG: HAD family phosphatase [Candidatus Magasanikiibacteriota bacterium]
MVIVFDLSGVFLNKGMKVAIKRISNKYNLEPEKIRFVLNGSFAEEYRSGLIDVVDFWEKAKNKLGVEDIAGVKQIFFDSYEPQKSSVELIKQIKSKGIRVGYLSNSPKDRTEYLDKKYNFISLFDFGLFSFDAHLCKPDKKVYEKLLEDFDLKAEDVIYTDDVQKNLEPAKELGIKTVLFNDVESFKKELEQSGIIL